MLINRLQLIKQKQGCPVFSISSHSPCLSYKGISGKYYSRRLKSFEDNPLRPVFTLLGTGTETRELPYFQLAAYRQGYFSFLFRNFISGVFSDGGFRYSFNFHRFSVGMSSFFHLFLCNLTAVDTSPRIENVGQHERNENRHVCHCFQRKLTGTTIGQSQ